MPDEIHLHTLTSDADTASFDAVSASLESVLALLETEDEADDALHTLCLQVVQAFPGAAMAGVTVLRSTGPVTAAATSDEAARLQELQHRLGEGPALDAARSGDTVRADRAGALERWPAYAANSAQAGVHSYLSVSLLPGTERPGALNMYGVLPHAFHRMDESVLELYVEAAAVAVRNARRYGEARHLIEQLRIALQSRAVIDQAKGIVMALRGLDAETAFDVLVARSQRENVKLRVVAERVVAAVSGRASVHNGL
ncbi:MULTISPECIES: GAF and ANTAR domain-containing protein [unclassified Rhodococcus (in: high G+C Gram-positive bacteria)]|uniref:GAF and ANTAR domain-containing protein n=1 Tax=unclassified Rhodococcus (in: high G+C Gram-positive bacteria) TaxID=192944 RepID=UPI00163AE457|nr:MULTISPECIES: GAF and ANTAR domain-containing protein [unclassified Rhodococcus (in: high G+C Gram-positive bacteria)]MBC2639516.1 GAF and ANTAR domain-containing protein [Rhodococcus sp. 3A]MBC2895739.1 GAF and ANTAR domain-containing protein [Rhodococcus sp. 4CII]